MNYLLQTKWLTTPRAWVRGIFERAIAQKYGVILYYPEPDRAEVLNLVRAVKKETKMLLLEPEAYQLFVLARGIEKIPGDIAEVGTYRGGSAKLLCEAAPQKQMHLFDTFEGLPEVNASLDAGRFHTGQYATPMEEVRTYLAAYPNARIYAGLFPQTAQPIRDKQFSLVHLDVDLYASTRAGLEFFYPRMHKGGAIISHDYANAQGVRRAFDEFFVDKPEIVIELSGGTQCLVIKL